MVVCWGKSIIEGVFGWGVKKRIHVIKGKLGNQNLKLLNKRELRQFKIEIAYTFNFFFGCEK